MTATFRIDQPGITGGKPPVGDWGKARADLDLASVGGDVSFTAQDAASSYLWQLISETEGSAITLGTPTSQTATVSITVTGGYLIRLTTDEGLPTKDVQERYFGVPLAESGLPIPALNETTQDNRNTTPGYERKMTAWMKWVDAGIGAASTTIFEEPVGVTGAAVRTGSGAVVEGHHAFSAGGINFIDYGSWYAFAYGGHRTAPAIANVIEDSEYATVFGSWNLITGYSGYSFVVGEQHDVYGTFCHLFGRQHTLGTTLDTRYFCLLAGERHTIDADQVYAFGIQHWCDNKGRDTVLLGQYVEARWPGSIYHAMNPYLIDGTGHYVLCSHLTARTSDDTWTDLQFSNGGPIYDLELRPRAIYLCELHLIGRTNDASGNPSDLKTWVVRFTVHNDIDDNVVVFPVDKVVVASTATLDEASWDVDVTMTMATSPPEMKVRAKGAAAMETRWYGVLKTVSYEDN